MILFPIVQFEYTNSLGPPPGRYPIKPDGRDDDAVPLQRGPRPSATLDGEDEDLQVGGSFGTADVAVIQVRGAATARPSRFRSKLPATPDGEEPAEVSVAIATIILATRVLGNEMTAQRFLSSVRDSQEAQEELAGTALDLLRRCVTAYRYAAADPYVADISPLDARATRIGYGEGSAVIRGGWTEAFGVRPPKPRRVTRTGRLMPAQAMAAILSGEQRVLESEELILAASRDLDHHRLRAAAMTLAAAVDLLLAELEGQELPGAVVTQIAELSNSREDTAEMVQRALADQMIAADQTRLAELIELAGGLVDAWRYVPLGFG